MRKYLRTSILILLVMVYMPAFARHHRGHRVGQVQSQASAQLQGQVNGIIAWLKKFSEELMQSTEVGRTISSAIKATDRLPNDIANLESDIFKTLQKKGETTLDDKLKALAGNNPERHQELRKLYGVDNDYSSSSERFFAAQTGNAMKSSDDALNLVTGHVKRIEKLKNKISSTQDLKSAEDLNARLLSEVAVLMTEMIKLQANTNNAMTAREQLEIDGLVRKSKFHENEHKLMKNRGFDAFN